MKQINHTEIIDIINGINERSIYVLIIQNALILF